MLTWSLKFVQRQKYINITFANLYFIAVVFAINYTITHLSRRYALVVCTQKWMRRANVTYMLDKIYEPFNSYLYSSASNLLFEYHLHTIWNHYYIIIRFLYLFWWYLYIRLFRHCYPNNHCFRCKFENAVHTFCCYIESDSRDSFLVTEYNAIWEVTVS